MYLMNPEESWLTEIITSQKRTLSISVLFLIFAVAIIPTGIFLLQPESGFVTFKDESKPPVQAYPHFKLAFALIVGGILLLLGVIYLWQFHTPREVHQQLRNLQELMDATLETSRREYRIRLPDGSAVTIKYIPYRRATHEFCGFQLRSSPLAAWPDTAQQEALRGGFALDHASVLSTTCSLEEFFPRALLLYKTIQRIRQFGPQTAQA